MTLRLMSVAVAIVIAAIGSAAHGQEPPAPAQDWVLARLPDRKAVIASAQFDNGITLTSRCMNGVFEVVIHGLPEARGYSRTLQFGVGDSPPYDSTWTVGQDSTSAFSRVPSRLARKLAQGGKLVIRVPPPQKDQPGIRYEMETASSASAVAETLTACGRPLVDPREPQDLDEVENGLSGGIQWDRFPSFSIPSTVRGRVPTRAFVTLSCVGRTTGRIEDCEIESEHPGGFNLGRAVVNAMARARVRSREPGTPLPDGRLFIFTASFTMSGS